MRQPVPALSVSTGQREVLESVARSQSAPHREVVRARALLMAADGRANTAIAESLSVSPGSVSSWRARFAEEGLVKFAQVREGRGRKKTIPQDKIDEIVDLTLNYRPEGETHWSCRTMAAATGVSKSTVQQVWSARGPQTAPGRDVQAVQRSELRGEAGRCRGALSESPREGHRLVRR
ncbi:transposase [Mycobacterium sp. URHB0021]